MPITTTMRVDVDEKRLLEVIRGLQLTGRLGDEACITLANKLQADPASPVGKWFTAYGVFMPKGGGK